MSVQDIKKLASSLSKSVDDSEKILLQTFSSKLSNASDDYPEDYTIGMVENVVSRMLGSNKLFITRAEVRELYNKLYSRNTKFSDVFKNELGEMSKLATPKLYNRFGTSEDNATDNVYDGVDPVLAASLHNAFGNSKKAFSDIAANNAKKACITRISELNPTIDVVDGNENVVICRASFDTPKGKVGIFIPVEIVSNAAAISPSMFVANGGVEDFNTSNVENYILSNAGSKLNITASTVIAAIDNSKDVFISDVDLALTKLNADKETQSDYTSSDYILGQKFDCENVKDIAAIEYKDPEVQSFAHALESPIGFASFKFSADKVKIGRNIIANAILGFGINDCQISVCDSDDNSISYAVSLNSGKVAFKVPVKIENGNVIAPNVMISNGSIESFSNEGVKNLFTKEASDYKMAAAASPVYDLKASELVNIVRAAVDEENFAKAEDALNVLMQINDEKAYQTAFAAYSNGLTGKKVVEACKCSFIVKNATSKHPICGHTNLPLHKVYTDKHGQCHPSYRQGMDETYEGAYFSNSKIFL